jgi:rhodanese-related sulfurtransferase
MTRHRPPAAAAATTESPEPRATPALEVNITADLASVDVMHHGRKVTIRRNQDQGNAINPEFALTSRKCPPFCIQPIELAPGVRTVAELEVLDFLKQTGEGDASIMVIDSRTPAWVEKGIIPGTINIPWNTLSMTKSDPAEVREILEKQFGATRRGASWDFDNARTLVMFCNGPWCGQSSTMINELLSIGYPSHRLLWYRGGVQDWEALGLSILEPSDE